MCPYIYRDRLFAALEKSIYSLLSASYGVLHGKNAVILYLGELSEKCEVCRTVVLHHYSAIESLFYDLNFDII